MIIEKLGEGLIYAGNSKLGCTIRVEQTGAMQLTVRKGKLTHPDGSELVLSSDAVFNLVADASRATILVIQLGLLNGAVDVWCGTAVQDGLEEINPPAGWQPIQPLTYNAVIPAGCSNLTPVPINVFAVKSGFPAGFTQMAGMQTGRL